MVRLRVLSIIIIIIKKVIKTVKVDEFMTSIIIFRNSQPDITLSTAKNCFAILEVWKQLLNLVYLKL